eukprot:jgi/Galph1/1728/GphlegSOOS_G419.1
MDTSFRVVDFVTARAQELARLREEIKKLGGKRQLFQTLPWHRRRRTMSHQSNRLPSRWKKNQVDATETTKRSIGKQKCRKYRRKVKWLRERLKHRIDRKDRLETHMWFAKRFHMTNYFDKQLPWCSVDRKERSAYRAAKNHSVIYDASFIDCWLLKDSQKVILSSLTKLLSSQMEESHLQQPEFLLGYKMLHTFVEFYSTNSPCYSTLIQVLWSPRDNVLADQVCEVLVFATFLSDQQSKESFIETFFSNVKTVMPLKLNRFHMIGPRSLTAMLRCFQMNSMDSKQLTVEKETNMSEMHEEITRNIFSPMSPIFLIRCHIPQGFHIGFPFFSRSSEIQVDFKSSHWVEEFLHWETQTMSSVAGQSWEIPIVLIPRHTSITSGKHTERWDLLVPSGFGCGLLHAVTHAGSQPIGLKEYRQILFENQVLHFPEDIPTTPLYKRHALETSCKNFVTFIKKPPAHRGCNLFPFSVFPPLWTHVAHTYPQIGHALDDLQQRLIQVFSHEQIQDRIKRGVENISSIGKIMESCCSFTLETQSIRNILQDTREVSNMLGHKHSKLTAIWIHAQSRGNIPVNAPIFETVQKKGSLSNLESKLIGYVTTTSYSFAKGNICAIGFVIIELELASEWFPVSIPRDRSFKNFIKANARLLESNPWIDF